MARSLFICSVLLLRGALIAAPLEFIARHAHASFGSLLRLAAGAVVLPQLKELEEILFCNLSEPRILATMLMHGVPEASGWTPPAQRVLALRWFVSALSKENISSELRAYFPKVC